MDFSELDAMDALLGNPAAPAEAKFNFLSRPKPVTSRQGGRMKVLPHSSAPGENWISVKEWMWRNGTRIINESRSKRGLRALDKRRDEEKLQEFLWQ